MTDSTTTHTRLQWLDGIRFILALWVVSDHAFGWGDKFPFPSGIAGFFWRTFFSTHVAVTAFIVVSGFSLMWTVVQNGDRLRGGVKGFFWRRSRRILTPYYAALILAICVSTYLRVNAVGWQRDLWPHFLLLHDWIGNTTIDGIGDVNTGMYAFAPSLWSIAVEEHIYWLFPLILVGWQRYGWARTTLTLCVVSLMAQVVAHIYGLLPIALHYFGPFSFGAAAAWLAGHGQSPSRAVKWIGSLTIPSVLLLNVPTGGWGSNFGLPLDEVWGAGVAVLLWSFATGQFSAASSVLGQCALSSGGRWSYSLYLVHYPVVAYLAVTRSGWFTTDLHGVIERGFVLTAISTVFAWAWSLVFEQPFLSGKRDPKFPDTVGKALSGFPVARAVASVAACAGSLLLAIVLRVDPVWMYLMPLLAIVAAVIAWRYGADGWSCAAGALSASAWSCGAFAPDYAQAVQAAAAAGLVGMAAYRRSWSPLIVGVAAGAAPLYGIAPALLLADRRSCPIIALVADPHQRQPVVSSAGGSERRDRNDFASAGRATSGERPGERR